MIAALSLFYYDFACSFSNPATMMIPSSQLPNVNSQLSTLNFQLSTIYINVLLFSDIAFS